MIRHDFRRWRYDRYRGLDREKRIERALNFAFFFFWRKRKVLLSPVMIYRLGDIIVSDGRPAVVVGYEIGRRTVVVWI